MQSNKECNATNFTSQLTHYRLQVSEPQITRSFLKYVEEERITHPCAAMKDCSYKVIKIVKTSPTRAL